MMAFGQYDAVLASRMLGNSALKGGMPLYKFIANKFLTWFENVFTGENLTNIIQVSEVLQEKFWKLCLLGNAMTILFLTMR